MTVNVQRRRRYKIRHTYQLPSDRHAASAQSLYLRPALICAAGIFMGAYSFSQYGGTDVTAQLCCVSPLRAFLDSFAAAELYVLLCFLAGFSSMGAPVGYLLCLFKGMGAGYLSACMMPSGILGTNIQAAAAILPFEVMSTAVVILAARENIRMSALTSKRTFGSAENDGMDNLRLYLAKFALITLAAAGISAADAIASLIFTGNFL